MSTPVKHLNLEGRFVPLCGAPVHDHGGWAWVTRYPDEATCRPCQQRYAATHNSWTCPCAACRQIAGQLAAHRTTPGLAAEESPCAPNR